MLPLRERVGPVGAAALAISCLLSTVGASGQRPDSPLPPWPAGTPVRSVVVATGPGTTLGFVPARVIVDRPSALRLVFENVSELEHNLVFLAGIEAASRPVLEPHSTEVLLIAELPPGRYSFSCTIHEGMTGALVIE